MANVVKLRLASGCYPRYDYFHDSLCSIFHRFKDNVDKGKLACSSSKGSASSVTQEESFSSRQTQVLEMDLSVQHMKDTPTVIVINDGCKGIHISDIVVSTDPFTDTHPREDRKRKWSTFAKDKECEPCVNRSEPFEIMVNHSLREVREEGQTLTVDTPYVIVAMMTLTGNREDYLKTILHNVDSLFSVLSEVQRDNLIIYIEADADGKSLQDLQENLKQVLDKRVRPVFPQVKESLSLAKTIQYNLETKPVRVLERISGFISTFSTKEDTDNDGGCMSLFDTVQVAIESVFSLHVLKDLEAICSTVSTSHSQNKTIDEEDMETSDSSSFEDNLIQMEEPVDLQKYETEIHSQSSVATVEKTFQETLRQHLYFRVANNSSNFLGKKFNFPPSVVNDFIHVFGFEEKLNKSLSNKFIPRSANNAIRTHLRKRPRSGKQSITGIAKNIHGVLTEMELFVKEKRHVIDVLFKIDFEIAALLRLTEVKVAVLLPPKPKLSKELQLDLLRQTGVNGCGMIYGKLTINANCDLDDETMKQLNYEIRDVLSKHRYTGRYDILKAQIIYHAGSVLDIETGNKIIVGNEKGTLGMFVRAKNNFPPTSKNDSGVYAVTCAHVLQGAHEGVRIQFGRSHPLLATTSETMMVNTDIHDIGCAKIEEDIVRNHNLHLLLRDVAGNESRGIIFDGDPQQLEGRAVYMWSQSEHEPRKGKICSVDFRSATGGPADEYASCFLIEADDNQEETDRFSEDGDSGSIVCYRDINSHSVIAISIFTGCYEEPTAGKTETTETKGRLKGKYLYGRSVELKSSLTALERQSGLIFELIIPESVHTAVPEQQEYRWDQLIPDRSAERQQEVPDTSTSENAADDSSDVLNTQQFQQQDSRQEEASSVHFSTDSTNGLSDENVYSLRNDSASSPAMAGDAEYHEVPGTEYDALIPLSPVPVDVDLREVPDTELDTHSQEELPSGGAYTNDKYGHSDVPRDSNIHTN